MHYLQSTISVLNILTDAYRANITKHNRYSKIYSTLMQTNTLSTVYRFKRQYQNRKHCQLTVVRQIIPCILLIYKY